jgi:hypothetical protein
MHRVQTSRIVATLASAALLTVIGSFSFAQAPSSTSLLHKGDEVVVSFEWLRDPGAVGGGSWLQETGAVQDVTDTMFALAVGPNKQIQYIPYTGVKSITLVKRP